MGSDCPCLSWEAKTIGMASGNLEVYLLNRVVALEWAHTIPLDRAITVVRFGTSGLSL